MKRQATTARGKGAVARKPAPGSSLTGLVVFDALRTWVIPTVAAVAGFVIFVLYSVELLDERVAVVSTGSLALSVLLFFGLRGFVGETITLKTGAILLAFAILWGGVSFYSFYRAVDPGPPLFASELKRNGPPVTIPLRGKAGHYTMTVEGHFLPAEGHVDRNANYSIAIGQGGVTEHVLEGAFSQQWGSQRVGAGRRSMLVPVMHQTTQHLDTIDDPDGHDLTARLVDLSPGVGDTLMLRVYTESVPRAVLLALVAVTVIGAVLIDAWRPKGVSEGLLTTLTAATVVGIVVFRASDVAAPGFPQLIVAALAGTLFGALAASVLWRVTQPIRKYLPARP